jgi:hypothetical protein
VPCGQGLTICKLGPSVYGCFDLQADHDMCGACWLECGPGTCISGGCQCPPAPFKYCPPSYLPPEGGVSVNACVDTSSDPVNCGDCRVRCGTDEWCVDGACVRDTRCDGVTCRSATVCGQVLPCETCVKGACEPLAPHFQGCVPSCGVAAGACGLPLTCQVTGGTCHPSYDCATCCTGP